MKNRRSYILSVIVLAVIMAFGILPESLADGPSNTVGSLGTYSYNATGDASISFASNGVSVGTNIAELNPNKVSSMTVSVPNTSGLPKNKAGWTIVNVPENVSVTVEDAQQCQSSDVSCEYRANQNQLAFKWINEAKEGFTATITITPKLPSTMPDVSGTRVLAVRNNHVPDKQLIAPKLEIDPKTDRLKAVEAKLCNGMIYNESVDLPQWTFQRVSGDWYTISCNGLYLNFGEDGEKVSLTGTPQCFLYTTQGAGNQFVGFAKDGTRYFLNNKSNAASNGIKASTWDDQCVELYSKLTTSGNQAFVIFNTNGGSASDNLQTVETTKGSSITLPEYSGTKSGSKFLGWATTNNIRINKYYRVYQPGESFQVEDSRVTLYATWSSTTPEKAQFGLRLSGDIPYEPAQYGTAEYTKEHVIKESTVKNALWTIDTKSSGKSIKGNHLENSVTANLSNLPTDEEIRELLYPEFDSSIMYVHWYVIKWAGGLWHVDGVIELKEIQSRITYNTNVSYELTSKAKNIPAAYSVKDGTNIKVGAGSNQKVPGTPTLADHEFKEWNTEADGSGQSYKNGATITVHGDITLYAQWKEIPKFEVSYSISGAPDGVRTPETFYHKANDTVTIAEPEDLEDYIFSGWTINGEKIEGSTFKMPKEDLVIEGTYYGPIEVAISSDWPDEQEGYWGAIITLTAIPNGPAGLQYTYQWQYLNNGKWEIIPDENKVTYTYELNEETSGRVWKVLIIDAKPIQE